MKYTKILVLILIILAVGYFFLEHKNPQKKPGVFATVGEYFFVKASDIDRVELASDDGNIVIVKQADEWRIESPLKSPADIGTVNALLGGIIQNPIHRVLPSDQIGELSEYGLSDTSESVTLYGGGKVLLDLKLGDRNPTGSDLYAKKGGGGEIFTTAVQIDDKLIYDPNHYRTRTPMRIDVDSVSSLVFTYPDSYWRLDRRGDTGNWYISEPEMFRAKNSKINRMLSQLKSMQVTEFLNQRLPDDDAHGLNTPEVVVEITSKIDNRTKTTKMILGETSVEKNAIYARLSDLPDEDVLIEASILHKLKLTADDLRENSLFLVDPTKIESLDVRERGAKNLSIYQTPKNEWKMISPNAGNMAESALKDFFQKLTNLRPSEYISLEDLDNIDVDVTGFESYKAKIVVKRRGDYSDLEIVIGNIDKDKGYYVLVSDIEGAYFVSEDLVAQLFDSNKRLKGV
ncbi:DUF4340 domain-containing protein [bacterium]|nr:DUF4340 domain-containing protein [bacterium]